MIGLELKSLSLEAALSAEWLDTNGRGGYASSTILNCHSRKYHGLLVSHLPEAGGRFVLLSKLEDSILAGKLETQLSMHQYPMVFFPSELKGLKRFYLGAHPRFIYEIGDIHIEKAVLLPKRKDTVLVRYWYRTGAEPILLRVKPLLAFRSIHELSRENALFRTGAEIMEGGFSVAPYEGLPRLFATTGGIMSFTPGAYWYRAFEYRQELDRGFPYQEDLLMPGVLECSLEPGESVIVCFSLDEANDPGKLWASETRRRQRRRSLLKKRSLERDVLSVRLTEAADSFIVVDSHGRTSVIAGYHWFYVWGRDTLISLPGLTFCRGMIREGITILKDISELRSNGLIPNCLSDSGDEKAFNSIDASLWYFWCLQELLRATSDMGIIIRLFWPVMKDIIEKYLNGSVEQVSRLENGLIAVGDKKTHLTWMDASVGSVPVTPRGGCPVEINALWFNALSFMRDVS
ncbi:MAG: glycogen debranching enzyme N-terminal domain-containing protein, partial [Syntrophales bacterium]|nr:glycogen debranching enzyme N-terminal domain-containing protein [Syntrophales bacterium]